MACVGSGVSSFWGRRRLAGTRSESPCAAELPKLRRVHKPSLARVLVDVVDGGTEVAFVAYGAIEVLALPERSGPPKYSVPGV